MRVLFRNGRRIYDLQSREDLVCVPMNRFSLVDPTAEGVDSVIERLAPQRANAFWNSKPYSVSGQSDVRYIVVFLLARIKMTAVFGAP